MNDRKVGTRWLWLFLAGFSAAGCGSDSSSGGPASNEYLGATALASKSQLPPCSASRSGGVYYLRDSKQFQFCDGKHYHLLNLKGLDGENGTTWLVTVSPASASDCPTGGALIQVGPDANADGDIDSVASAAVVCNGAEGPQGPPGTDGMNGAPGQDGGPGMNGLTSLVRLDSFDSTADCPNGGTRVSSGLDLDGDGELSDEEVTDTDDLCALAVGACAEGEPQVYCADVDNDDYASACEELCPANVPPGWKLQTELSGDTVDCDDTNAGRFPGNVELCDYVDTNCVDGDEPAKVCPCGESIACNRACRPICQDGYSVSGTSCVSTHTVKTTEMRCGQFPCFLEPQPILVSSAQSCETGDVRLGMTVERVSGSGTCGGAFVNDSPNDCSMSLDVKPSGCQCVTCEALVQVQSTRPQCE